MDDEAQATTGTSASSSDKKKSKPPRSSSAGNDLEPVARTLLQILPRRMLIGFAAIAVIGALALAGIAVVWPEIVSNAIARFWFCVLVSFLFAMFSFLLYPTRMEFPRNPVAGVLTALVGPSALWIALLLLLLKYAPEQVIQGYVFHLAPGSQRPMLSNTFVSVDPPPIAYFLFEDRATRGGLGGIYLEFDKSVSAYSMRVQIGPDEDHIVQTFEPITLRRGMSRSEFRL